MFTKFLVLFLASALMCGAAVYEEFPGFKDLFERADFVGVVKLGARDIQEDEAMRTFDSTGPHRFFQIESKLVLKGEPISENVARLADRRLGTRSKSVTSIRNQEILAPEGLFLVFLKGSVFSKGRYQWDEIHAEGAVLPVTSKTNLHTMRISKETPLTKINQIVSDYTDFCRQLFEQAVIQQTLIEALEESK